MRDRSGTGYDLGWIAGGRKENSKGYKRNCGRSRKGSGVSRCRKMFLMAGCQRRESGNFRLTTE